MIWRPLTSRPLPVAGFVLATLGAPHAAYAQPAPLSNSPAPAPPAAAASGAADDRVALADAHFRRAVDRFKERSYDAALAEFRRAYQIAPSYRVLYNVARCQVELRQYAGAYTSYRTYLDQGAAGVPADRRVTVEAELGRLEGRVARVTVRANVDGTHVVRDDEPVATLARHAPVVLVVDIGSRRFAFEAPGHARETRVVELAGGDDVTLQVELRPDEAPRAAVPSSTVTAPASAPLAVLPPSNPAIKPTRFPWTTVGLIATGALAAGATASGIFALDARSDRREALDRFPADQAELDRYGSRAKTYAALTDVLVVAAVVVGGATLWHALTPRAPVAAHAQTPVRLQIAPGAGLLGTF